MDVLQNKSGSPNPTEIISTEAHYVIAGVYAFLAVTAISLNTPVLIAFIKDRALCTPSNRIILSIAVGDWLHAVLAYPLGVVANASHGWQAISGVRTGCTWYAFITTFLSFGIMLHHATFAIERALVLNFAVTSLTNAKRLNFVLIALWGFALLWSCFPLFGWSAYAPEGDSALCSIRWQSSDPRDIAFIGCIFFFFFVAPIVTMVTAYSKIYRNVKKMTQSAHGLWGKNAAPTQESVHAEIKTARMAFTMSFCFLFAWTPYATVSLYSAIGKQESISPLVATLPALFAKTAACYNPVIYFFSFKKFRDSLRKTMRPMCGRFMKQDAASSTNIEMMRTAFSWTGKYSKKWSTSESPNSPFLDGQACERESCEGAKSDASEHDGQECERESCEAANPDSSEHDGQACQRESCEGAKSDASEHDGQECEQESCEAANPDSSEHDGQACERESCEGAKPDASGQG